ncbi:hypothetical protein BpHYR1_046935 [Brachionus plicatilis]|uniref:Uncharacterized protein n=1 Tax=Brachionus plicatilis TaxID=10195 RepID=A0A3M7RG52_BRAPC|nr:hypothetical protein BpHYR1_046935 [Brachionus plicatilis]
MSVRTGLSWLQSGTSAFAIGQLDVDQTVADFLCARLLWLGCTGVSLGPSLICSRCNILSIRLLLVAICDHLDKCLYTLESPSRTRCEESTNSASGDSADGSYWYSVSAYCEPICSIVADESV